MKQDFLKKKHHKSHFITKTLSLSLNTRPYKATTQITTSIFAI